MQDSRSLDFKIVNIPPISFLRLSTASGVMMPEIFAMVLFWAARISYASFFALLVMVPLHLVASCWQLPNDDVKLGYYLLNLWHI